ncbi:hypothetical protein OC834_005518 [Tilletia horrida]|nr:hypothetical protein OC834_005518 [Tilletia horrida]KAK0559716.1 hypothetical protein OC844_004217 [Tilletia horrida]
MATPTLTDLHLAAGHPLQTPTYLAMSGDVLVPTPADVAKEGEEVLFMLRDFRLVQADLCSDYGQDVYSGVYNFSNAILGTQPMSLFLPGDANARLVPEDIDGCDPLLSSLPWRGPVLNGIGVVTVADGKKGKITISGRSWHGAFVGWIPFKVHGRVEDGLNGPFSIPYIPGRGTLVSFDGIMDGVTDDGGVEALLYRIQHLQHAHPTLLIELGVVKTAREDRKASEVVAQALRDAQLSKQLLTNGEADPCMCAHMRNPKT